MVIADDSADMRLLLGTVLGAEFDVVGEAADGIEVIELVARQRPDVVVLDYLMPGATGLEAVAAIKAESPSTRVVLMSGFGQRQVVDDLARTLPDAWVEKGSPVSDVIAAVVGVTGEGTPDGAGLATPGEADLNERSAAAALAESRMMLDATLDAAWVPLALTTASGRFIRANPAFLELAGRRLEELAELTWPDLLESRDVARTMVGIDALLEGRSAHHLDRLRLWRPDSDPVWVDIRLSPVGSPAGTTVAVLVQADDVTARRADEARLAHQAHHDPLTDLPNRTLLIDRLGLAVARLGRSGGLLAVVFCDLDRFKAVNDSLGHGAGDEVLRQVATRLRDTVRPADTVARLGGDEFVILCEGLADTAAAESIVLRVCDALGEPVVHGGGSWEGSASFGVVIVQGSGHEPQDLLRRADQAMYRAKEMAEPRRPIHIEVVIS
ncbi:MAG TPA: diguanylate cyclase [Acidimicrobiales bacterium]|nr:diguanylate cyclase [Acidimicrobiales bacterium]